MSGVEVDTHQLRLLSMDLIQAGPRGVKMVEPIMKKAAQNIKKAMQADVKSHPHFKQLAATISYDVKVNTFAGQGSIEAEIGFDKDRMVGFGVDGPAALAGIAIFGSSKPGGGTVRNPEEALNDEAPVAEQWIADAMDGLL